MDLFFGYPGEYNNPREVFERDDVSTAAADRGGRPGSGGGEKKAAGRRPLPMGKNVLEVCTAGDIVFMALHGADGEDGKVQAAFDLAGIRYTGTGPLGSAIAMNKSVAKTVFHDRGVKTPEGITLTAGAAEYPELCYPCVGKPCSGGSSVGTHIVQEKSEYLPALADAFRYDGRCWWSGISRAARWTGRPDGRALPPIEICPEGGFYDYKNKYQKGMATEICPADFPHEITEKLKKAAVDAYRALMFEVYAAWTSS
jgi:D-alanine-D-alanine ligase